MQNEAKVVQLMLYEGVAIDAASLAILRHEDSDPPSDCKVDEALEDLALGLSRLAAAYREDRFGDLAGFALEVGDLARALGLDRLARVARTVAGLCRGQDAVALAANLARLMRLGNAALGKIWDLQDRIV